MGTWKTAASGATPRTARVTKDDSPDCEEYDSIDECIGDGFTRDECEECADLEMSAKGTCACAGGAKKRQATHRLQGLAVHEISLVDHPANEMPFLKKSREQRAIERARVAAERARAEVTFKGGARPPEKWIAAKVLGVALMKSENGNEVSTLLAVVAQPGATDSQGDVMSKATIAAAERAYAAATPRCVRLQHAGACVADERVRIAESFVTPKDATINGVAVKAGSWVVAIRVADPRILAAVRSGAIGGVSLGGVAQRTPVAEKNRPRALVWPGDMAKAATAKREHAETVARRTGLERVADAAHPPDVAAVVAAKRELGRDIGNRAGLDLAADVARKGRGRGNA